MVLALPAAAPASDEIDAPPRRSRQESLYRLGLLAAPALIYLGIRQLSLVVLAIMSSGKDVSFTHLLTVWDGQWYLSIAERGYLDFNSTSFSAINVDAEQAQMAFFPAYPTLVGWLEKVPGFSYTGAGFAISTVSGVVAAYGLLRLARIIRGGGSRAGYLLIALFAASPMGIVLSMVYTEALFCALAVWVLVFVLEQRWIVAGVLCCAAGLVRSTALALVVAVCLAALFAIIKGRGRWQPLLGGLLAPLGLFGYLLWVGFQVSPDAGAFTQLRAWSTLEEEGWNTKFDGGVSTAEFVVDTLADGDMVMSFGAVAAIIGSIVLLGLGIKRRIEWPLLVYAGAVLVMVLGSSSLMNSKPRFLLVAFVLLIPPALALAKRRTSTAIATVAGFALLTAWYGAHALTVWPEAI